MPSAGITRAGLWLKTFIPSSTGRKPQSAMKPHRVSRITRLCAPSAGMWNAIPAPAPAVVRYPGVRVGRSGADRAGCGKQFGAIVPHIDPGTKLGCM